MTANTNQRHDWRVTGMDCAACAAKITTALGRLPGVAEVQIAVWAFVAAGLIGVAPVARRVFVALPAGIPFTIEGLMAIAAIGALFIGAADEAALVVFLFAVGEVLDGVAADSARWG